jgi:CRP/FNR family transcriptional regulator, cyclic AMP receptor protein
MMDANRLRFVEVFDDFDDRELELLASVMDSRRYRPGQHVFRKGDRATACYVVLAGSVNVTVDGDRREEAVVANMTTGRMFGEISLVDGGLRSATCVASDKGVELAVLGRAEFDQIFNAGSPFAYKLMDLIGARVVDRVRAAAGELLGVFLNERSGSGPMNPD